jgi:tripartite-type tricarboxylate transporter receptor subunit TctC
MVSARATKGKLLLKLKLTNCLLNDRQARLAHLPAMQIGTSIRRSKGLSRIWRRTRRPISSSLTTYAFNLSLYKDLRYDPAKDFVPVSLTGRFAFLLVANPAFAANSLSDLIAIAEASPDKLVFASAGPGSPHQLTMELPLGRTGVRMIHMPYKGASAALKDVKSGQVPVMMLDMATARTH